MKISIVGPGVMPIPPIGWGAIEILIWDYKITLEQLGHQVQIINTTNPVEIIGKINQFRPDFVHIQYDDFIFLYPYIQYPCAITTHFAYIERPELMGDYRQRVFNLFSKFKPCVFGLSDGINQVYQNSCDIPSDKLFLNPNGVNLENFKKSKSPQFFNRSIYLATIDYRKRQSLFQDIESLWYAGNVKDNAFNKTKNYLGEWSKDYLYKNLTEYGNLVLLSDGEAHPLVCMEALAAGLGVVVTEWGKANLDESKNFITVIPENKINDIKYIEDKIVENREYSINNRQEIFEYSQKFDWKNTIEKYYLPNIQKVIKL